MVKPFFELSAILVEFFLVINVDNLNISSLSMLTVVHPFTFVGISSLVLDCSLAVLHTLMPLALVLPMRSDLGPLSLSVPELEMAYVPVLFYVRVLIRLWMLTFLFGHLFALSMFKIILELSIVGNSLRVELLALALSFSINKLPYILPYHF